MMEYCFAIALSISSKLLASFFAFLYRAMRFIGLLDVGITVFKRILVESKRIAMSVRSVLTVISSRLMERGTDVNCNGPGLKLIEFEIYVCPSLSTSVRPGHHSSHVFVTPIFRY